MSVIIITGSAGLIGSEASRFFHQQGFDIIGIDNDMRAYFFGQEASTQWNTAKQKKELKNFKHVSLDIRDQQGINDLFAKYGNRIKGCLLYTSPSPRDLSTSRMPSSA